jgi:hypothetical protein
MVAGNGERVRISSAVTCGFTPVSRAHGMHFAELISRFQVIFILTSHNADLTGNAFICVYMKS